MSTVLYAEIKTNDDRSYSMKLHTYSWDTNWNKRVIEFDELQSGGPPRDGIPPIDKPKFVTIQEASSWLSQNEPLIFVNINGKTKAYPLQVLLWHEIVNDSIENTKIAVTFCPLCNASIVFNRELNGKTYDFGTSGLLRNSDLVMYDRQTQSLWQQFTGSAIVGDLTTEVLTQLPSSIVSFKDIREHYPSTLILSKDTGHSRSYGKNPYIGYDDINQTPFMLKAKADERLFPMQRVSTVSINNADKAYSYSKVKRLKVINDSFENKNLVLFFNDNVTSALDKSDIATSKKSGSVLMYSSMLNNKKLEFYYDRGIYDKQSNSKWNIFGVAIEGELKGQQLKPLTSGTHFWFAWAVFKPDTIIYK